MRKTEFRAGEQQCWKLIIDRRSLSDIIRILDANQAYAIANSFGAAAVAIRQWQSRQRPAFLKKVFRTGRTVPVK